MTSAIQLDGEAVNDFRNAANGIVTLDQHQHAHRFRPWDRLRAVNYIYPHECAILYQEPLGGLNQSESDARGHFHAWLERRFLPHLN